MKTIKTDDLFEHLNDFLKARGIELKEGGMSERVRQGCAILTDSINLAQKTMARARVTMDQKLDHMREVIHDKTAPPAPAKPSTAAGKPKRKTTARIAPPKPRAKAKAAKAKPARGTKRRPRSQA